MIMIIIKKMNIHQRKIGKCIYCCFNHHHHNNNNNDNHSPIYYLVGYKEISIVLIFF